MTITREAFVMIMLIVNTSPYPKGGPLAGLRQHATAGRQTGNPHPRQGLRRLSGGGQVRSLLPKPTRKTNEMKLKQHISRTLIAAPPSSMTYSNLLR